MAASAQNQPANVDLFDLYFRRADLDRDGRISGLEAVTFFQASGLPKPVLAKVIPECFVSLLPGFLFFFFRMRVRLCGCVRVSGRELDSVRTIDAVSGREWRG